MSKKTISIIFGGIVIIGVALLLTLQLPFRKPYPSVTPPAPTFQVYPPIYSETITPSPIYDISQRSPAPNAQIFERSSFPSPSPVATIEQSGIVWLKEPIEMTKDPGVFKSGGMYKLGDGTVTMYKVGTQDGKDLFYVFITEMGQSVQLFRNDGNRFALISHDSPDMTYYSDRVYVDKTTVIAALAIPHPLDIYGVPFTNGGGNFLGNYFFGKIDSSMSLFAYTPYGPMYLDRTPATIDKPVESQIFSMRLVDGGGYNFDVDYGFIKDDRVPQITWSDGTKNTDTYDTGHSGGCGQGDPEILPFSAANGKLFQVGTTSTGEAVYDVVDPLSPILKYYYDQTNGVVYSYGSNGQSYDVLRLSDFLKNHGIFIYRDQLGRFVAFHNTVYGPQVECGKPVIYLYPTKPTQVSVKVGAMITKSEPAYNGGWNVLAEPTGKQTLFWEGLGNGPYPQITQGFVVKRADLESTLRAHLSALGLNKREAQDFMDFWWPRMPTTPYVRLTWFGTRQMDALAPLAVSPKPDTSIRVFLDFEGLQKPITLPPQRLYSIPRQGFTLVEWGGLLRN